MIHFKKQRCLILTLSLFLSAFFGSVMAQEGGFDDGPAKPVAATDEPMFRVIYTVPPTFLTATGGGSGSAAADPFADPVKPPTPIPKKLLTAQKVLERAGVEFPPGASAVFNLRSSTLEVTNTADQLNLLELFIGGCHYCPERQIQIFVEFIEVEAALYHDWMFKNRITQDGTALRKQSQKWVKAGEATIIETSSVLARSGQRAKTQSVRQIYYPTQATPAKIPNEVDLEGAETHAPIAAGQPGSFDRRDVGTTVELDPVLGADNATIDLNLSPEIVLEKGTIDWPPEEGGPLFTVSLPEFNMMKITTQITTQHGRYAFLGTTTPLKPAFETRKRPLVMMFARGDVLSLGEHEYEPFERVPVEKK